MRERFLLVDFLNLFYRSLFAYKDLSYKEAPTGALFGFAVQLNSAIGKIKPSRLFFCIDSPPYLRTAIYPQYKQGRKKREKVISEENIRFQLKTVKKFIELLGYSKIGVSGLEADDLIAIISRVFKKQADIIAYSNDSDLYQLLRRGFSIYRGKEKGFYTAADLYKEFGISRPKQWVDVMAYAGSHNGFSGIAGVKEKTAIKMLRDKEYEDKILSKLSGAEINDLEMYSYIARLPFFRSYPTRFRESSFPVRERLNKNALTRFLNSYGIFETQRLVGNFVGLK